MTVFWSFRSSHPEEFYKIENLKNFAIFREKHFCWSPWSSVSFPNVSKSIFFIEHLQGTAIGTFIEYLTSLTHSLTGRIIYHFIFFSFFDNYQHKWECFFGKIVYKMSDEWYIEWQRVITSDNEWQRLVQRVTTTDSEWQRLITKENEWLFRPIFFFFERSLLISTLKRTL